LRPRDFKSLASTRSATQAFVGISIGYLFAFGRFSLTATIWLQSGSP
jgi:hypothetical protein